MAVLFLNSEQFKKKFPDAKMAKMPRSVERPHFRNPAQFQIRFPRWTLCQGFSKGNFETLAWVEYRGYCLNLANISKRVYFSIIVGKASTSVVDQFIRDNKISRDQFYERYGISSVRRYTKAEARRLMEYYQNYGMWKEGV
jgi:hypothetical protein